MSKDRGLFTEKVDVQVHVQAGKALKLKDRRPLAVFFIICWVGMMWISPSIFEQNVISGLFHIMFWTGHAINAILHYCEVKDPTPKSPKKPSFWR